MTLDEFNLVCYVSMYDYLQTALTYQMNNKGN